MSSTVTLDNRGNPDRDQDPTQRSWGTQGRVVEVADLAEASRVAVAYVAEYGLGGGNWPGAPVTDGGKPVAMISYNGVARPPGEWRSDIVPLHDPRPARKPAADPHAFDSAELDLGDGLRVSVTGCLRVASWRLTGDTAKVDKDLLAGWLLLSRDVEPVVDRHAKGRGAKAVFDRVEAAIRAWHAEPEARAMILGNQVKDARRDLGHDENAVRSREADLAKARDALAVARVALAEAEAELENLATATPSP